MCRTSIYSYPFICRRNVTSVAITKMTNSPLKIISILETISIVGLVFGCVFSLFAWIGHRKREREETDELMHEYLRKKLQEENDKQG